MSLGLKNRRTFLTLAVSGLAAFADRWAMAADAVEKFDLSITGNDDSRLRSFDRLIASFIKQHKIPGAALAVTKDSRLVYARGFGLADVENKAPVQPESLFRIASISKPITAVAVMQLAERGKLSLDDKAFALLSVEPHLADGAKFDSRLNDITIRQLLQHTGGFDRAVSFDPMVGQPSVEIAQALGESPPAKPEQIIRFMLGRPLDFAPGERFAYSNFGYCVLGRVIEKVSGQNYEAYVREHVLAPLGIRRMQIGKTLASDRTRGEVKYYLHDHRQAPAVVGPHIGERVDVPYGAWYLEAMDAHGGWIASAIDLVRFAAAFDDPAKCKILSEKSIAAMFARPSGETGERYYSCGWSVVDPGNKERPNHWHTGGLDGTSTLLVRRGDGLNWAVLFNAGRDEDGEFFCSHIDPLVHRAADEVTEWPDGS